MGIEIIADKVPFTGQWVCIDTALDMLDKILFVACLAGCTSSQYSG